MPRLPSFFGLLLAAGLVASSDLAAADSDLAGSSWTVVVAQQCQLGQIGKILLQPDGTAQATAQVENSTGSMTVPGDSQSTDLQGSWSYADNVLHLSFNEGSLTLDGPVKNGKFMAKAVMKTDLGDPMLQDCLLKRN
jgi:hypothetical protein